MYPELRIQNFHIQLKREQSRFRGNTKGAKIRSEGARGSIEGVRKSIEKVLKRSTRVRKTQQKKKSSSFLKELDTTHAL